MIEATWTNARKFRAVFSYRVATRRARGLSELDDTVIDLRPIVDAQPQGAGLYGAEEMPTADYRARTEANVRRSEATLWFESVETPEAKATLNACRGMGRPHLLVIPGRDTKPSEVATWARAGGFKKLNCAGNRESKATGIGARVERFMAEVLRQFSHDRPAV